MCPHRCSLLDGDVGKCFVRRNKGGMIHNSYDGVLSFVAVDPIEKRPFFHFYPGSDFLSVGLYGCSFQCVWCENHKISQCVKKGKYTSPNQLVKLALEKKVKGIVFTYNEPIVHYEYVMTVANIAQTAGLQVALKSNGFATEKVVRDLNLHVDAWNIDIKGDDKEYKSCGGDISSVMSSIELLGRIASHLEISYVVPGRLVSHLEHHIYIRDWLSSLSPIIPIHLLYLYPSHKVKEFYNKSDLIEIYEVFREKMDYVYISNLYDTGIMKRDTLCPRCNSVLISRAPLPSVIRTSCCEDLAGIFS